MKVFYFLFILLLCNSCFKEKILNKKDYPDKGEIFLSGYINNIGENAIAIFGQNLLNQGIHLFIDTGLGFKSLDLNYNSKDFQYNCDLSQIKFRTNVNYKFKLVSTLFEDSAVFNEILADSFKPQILVNYPKLNEFYANIKINPETNSHMYSYDINYQGSFGDTNNSQIPTTGNLYLKRLLPYLRDVDGQMRTLDEFQKINNLNLQNGLRFPYASIFYKPCAYLAIEQKFIFTLTRFFSSDFEYINSLCDNVKNEGNPFFLHYQIKNLIKSQKEHIYGNIVSSYISNKNSFVIKDYSDTAIKIFIKENGIDLIGDPQYKLSYAKRDNITFTTAYTRENYIYLSKNIIEHIYGDCKQESYKREKDIVLQFGVRKVSTQKTKYTNIITFNLKDIPLILNFEVK